jgi:hypothetical protein
MLRIVHRTDRIPLFLRVRVEWVLEVFFLLYHRMLWVGIHLDDLHRILEEV